MFVMFSFREVEMPPVWERAVHSINCACLSLAFINLCVLLLSLLILSLGSWI